MHTALQAMFNGAVPVADALGDWMTDTLRGFAAAAPVLADPGGPGARDDR